SRLLSRPAWRHWPLSTARGERNSTATAPRYWNWSTAYGRRDCVTGAVMSESSSTQPSRSRVYKAGQRIRRYFKGDSRAADVDIRQELIVIDQFRAGHQVPLSKANMGLRFRIGRIFSSGEPIPRPGLDRHR